MDHMSSDGFFKEFYANVLNNCADEEKLDFAGAKTDEERFCKISEWSAIQEMTFDWKVTCKNSELGVDLKNKGNAAFQQNNWAGALELYNESLMVTPIENEEDLAVVLANRSAVFYHLKQFKLAVEDIQAAISKYPKEKAYKLKERQAKCYLALNDFPKSIEAFKETIHFLDISGLPIEKSGKSEKDAQIMIKMLTNKLKSAPKQKEKKAANIPQPKDSTDLSSSICFDYTPSEGYFAKAKNKLKVGEKILEEPPHCSVLLEKFRKTHCHHCFLRTISPVPCTICANIIFCSDACRNVAQSTYHKFECGILPLIWQSGSSVNCHMALRIMAMKNLNYFLEIKSDLKDNEELDAILKLPISDYRTVYNLVRHEDKDESSFLQYTIMAAFLTYCLSLSDYFKGAASANETYNFIGGLILRNLQFLKYNTHEIYELRQLLEGPKTVFIGGGVYPTLARFNHSCNPGIVRYYKGTSVVVHAVSNISSGSIVAENYGPIYSQNPIDERQATLKDLYRFECNCRACSENWPLYENMNPEAIRLKCTGSTNCDNVILIEANCNDFMIKCSKCNQLTNILKGLKAVQDTEMLCKTAQRLMKERDYTKATAKLQEILKIMDEYLVPPFRDYCVCQQSLKECILQLGNRNVHFKE